MDIKVQLNNIRVAPRKARRVIDLIRGKKTQEAKSILSFTVNKSSLPVLKLLNSAVAAAKNNFQLDESNLFVSKVTVDEGPKLKRSWPMSRGRAYPIMKRTSHIQLVLSELNASKKSETKNEKVTDAKAAKTEKVNSKVKKTRTKTKTK